jgi:hypothetical protein
MKTASATTQRMNGMKLWIDVTKDAPDGCIGVKTVTNARVYLMDSALRDEIDVISLGDNDNSNTSMRFLEWLEEKGRSFYKIHLHGDNDLDKKMMRKIIKRNGWEEV